MSNHTHKILWTIMAGKNKFKSLDRKLDVFSGRTESSFTRFLTVRHPLTRLYSGWNEHLELKPNGKGGMKVRGQQAKLFGILKKDWTKTHACTFPKFIELMLQSIVKSELKGRLKPSNIDGHHRPISDSCMVCQMQYEFIMKQETMDEDSNYFLKNILKDSKIELEKQKVRNGSPDPYSHLKKYCDIDDTAVKAIERYYKLDFELFGYDKFVRDDVC